MKKIYILIISIFFVVFSLYSEEQPQNGSIKTNEKKTYNSIMFTSKNIEDIERMMPFLKLNLQKGKIEKNLTSINNDLEFAKNNIINSSDTNLYLNSILYLSKNHWAIWINGNKITNLDKNEDIVVTNVSPLNVSFYWRMSNKRWEIINISNQISKSKYKFDGNYVNLYLKLNPNQTYVSLDDKIVEGKAKTLEEKAVEQMTNINNNYTQNQTNLEKNDNIFF